MLTLRLLLFGSLALTAGVAYSTGTARAQAYVGAFVLQDPISVRVTSMGQAGTADNSDPANVWFNPANAVGATGVYVEYGTWKIDPFFDLEIPYSRWAAGGSFAAGDNVVAGVDATFGELDYGTLTATSSTGEPLGMYDIWERYLSVALAVAADLGDHVELRLGAAGKHFWADYGVDVDLDELTPEGFAFDVGVTGALPAELSGWTVTPAIAFAYVNFGGEIEFDEGSSDPFPSRLHYGASVRVDSPTVALGSARVPLLSFVNNVDAADRLHGDSYSWGMGAELAVMQVLFLRAGVMDDQDEEPYIFVPDPRDQSAWSIGVGVPVGPFRGRFDYARVAGYEEPRYGFTAAWEF